MSKTTSLILIKIIKLKFMIFYIFLIYEKFGLKLFQYETAARCDLIIFFYFMNFFEFI